MSVERGEDKQLDIIRWMGKISSEESAGVIHRIGLEMTGGPDKGKLFDIIAPLYRIEGNRFVIVNWTLNPETGEEEPIPILAKHIPSGIEPININSVDIVAKRLRRVRKERGTKRTGLGHF